jgi:hypothetical protein
LPSPEGAGHRQDRRRFPLYRTYHGLATWGARRGSCASARRVPTGFIASGSRRRCRGSDIATSPEADRDALEAVKNTDTQGIKKVCEIAPRGLRIARTQRRKWPRRATEARPLARVAHRPCQSEGEKSTEALRLARDSSRRDVARRGDQVTGYLDSGIREGDPTEADRTGNAASPRPRRRT